MNFPGNQNDLSLIMMHGGNYGWKHEGGTNMRPDNFDTLRDFLRVLGVQIEPEPSKRYQPDPEEKIEDAQFEEIPA